MFYEYEKMNGLGNDFIIFDKRHQDICLLPSDMAMLSDRSGKYGCDQIIMIENDNKSDAFMRIYNGDGIEAEACGNALRCVGHKLLQEKQVDSVNIQTRHDILVCRYGDDKECVEADMGEPRFDWQDIPLSHAIDTLYMEYDFYDNDVKIPLPYPSVVNMGNPHCIFFLDFQKPIDLKRYGPIIEHDSLFPQRVNVNVAFVESCHHIILNVWEREAGITQACGSGACATAVAAIRKGLSKRRVRVSLPGGDITVFWNQHNNRVYQTARVEYQEKSVFTR